MRQLLRASRAKAGKTQKEIALSIGISERYYQHLEAGTREGKGAIWDQLENLFDLPQRDLRKVK